MTKQQVIDFMASSLGKDQESQLLKQAPTTLFVIKMFLRETANHFDLFS